MDQKFPVATGHHDDTYLQALAKIYHEGEDRTDRTGTGTRSLFGDIQMKFDLRQGFPLLTTKFVHFHSIKHELLWMLSGSTNIRYLKENKVRIWDEWLKPETAEYRMLEWGERVRRLSKEQLDNYVEVTNIMREDFRSERYIANVQNELLAMAGIPEKDLIAGELGPVYGSQWRKWQDNRVVYDAVYESKRKTYDKLGFTRLGRVGIDYGMSADVIHREIDQIAKIEHQLKNNPDSRRIILSGWNVAMVDEMALPPCHTLAQWYVSTQTDEKGRNYLDCKLYMRSNDFFLGGSFNIPQYSLLTEMFAHVAGMTPRYYFHTVGDAHIYTNHMEQVRAQMGRPIKHFSPKIKIHGSHKSVLDIKAEDIELIGYEYQPAIKAPVAV